MSPDEVQLLVVLYLFYWSSCLVRLRTSGWLLYNRFSGFSWRLKSTRKAAVFGDRFWLLRPLIPPLGSSYELSGLPISFGAQGFCNVSPLADRAGMTAVKESFLAYEEFETAEVREGALLINGTSWWAGHPADLEGVKSMIEAVASAGEPQSEVRLWLQRRFEMGRRATAQIEMIEHRMKGLKICSSIYGGWLLLFTPVLLFNYSMLWQLWGVAMPLLFLHLVCAFLFFRAHQQLVPHRRYARHESLWKMLLCPPSMIRACDHVTGDLVVAGDPMAVMEGLTKESVWLPELQSVWRRVMPRAHLEREGDIAGTVDAFSALYRDVFHHFLEQQGIDPRRLEFSEDQVPVGMRGCPCCEMIYTHEVTVCADCGGVPLIDAGDE